MWTTTRHEEKSLGDFAFNKYGNPSYEVSVPKPQPSTKTTTEVMQFGYLWSVSIKCALAACKATSEDELVALGATKIRALEPGEDD